MQYVALLRGINVGGNNIIKMTELKACFDAQGYTNVATYIQSGNVLFEAEHTNPVKLTTDIERALTTAFNYEAKAVVRSRIELEQIIKAAPPYFNGPEGEYRCDVIFMKEPATVEQAMAVMTLKEGVDMVEPGTGVVYFARLTSRATQSRLSRIISLPIYKNMTIRNWNTTRKLLQKMEELAAVS